MMLSTVLSLYVLVSVFAASPQQSLSDLAQTLLCFISRKASGRIFFAQIKEFRFPGA
ncbi:hypothetical protein [Undibacterium luofuense]|uniref:Uncharacterized protein n=1 Tax=Undibacterium luofuense TaxID=2828733 RepID=A0A941DIN5_9BURK|nr:hypothetical protein [Undibacterium luofuense]MBR7781652.1 hypothetical protein [Undibacterium luofuense]